MPSLCSPRRYHLPTHKRPARFSVLCVAMANLRQLRNDYICFSSLYSPPQKTKFRIFVFSSSTQLLTKTLVLLRSCKILKSFTSFCFAFTNFWNIPIRFTIDFEKIGLILFASLCCSKILEQPVSFRFDLQKFRNKQFVSFSILLYFGLDQFLLQF